MTSTESRRTELADRFQDSLRTAVLGMPKGSRPKRLGFFWNDAARRKTLPLGRFPEAAVICINAGAGLAEVLRPLHETEAYLRAMVGEKQTPLPEAILREQKEQGEADVVGMVLAENCHKPSDYELEVFIKEASEHYEALGDLIRVARSLRYAR